MATITKPKQQDRIESVIVPFLKANSSGRVSKETLNYFNYFSLANTERDEVVIVEIRDDNVEYDEQNPLTGLLAISVCVGNKYKGSITCSTTVVKKEERRKGYGSLALKKKIEILRIAFSDYVFMTTVAEDSKAGVGLCKKSGLSLFDRGRGTRRTGEYVINYFRDQGTQ